MEYFVDWNCRLIPSAKNQRMTVDAVSSALQTLHQRDRISHFCMMNEYSGSFGSIPAYMILWEKTCRELRAASPKQIKLRFATSVPFYSGLHQLRDVDRLCIGDRCLLPITLPLAPYADWIDAELNALLYQAHITPMFLSFDLSILLYPEEVFQKLLRISNAVYQFSYKSLTNPKVLEQIRYVLSENPTATILLGTTLASLKDVSFHETSYYLKRASELLPPMEFQMLLHHGRAFWRS